MEIVPQSVSDWLFLETVEDLRARSAKTDASSYELLGTAALLRKLLLDSDPLMHQVNTSRQMKVAFSFTPYALRPAEPNTGVAGGWMMPLLSVSGADFGRATVTSRLDTFLRAPVGEFERQLLSVRDVIRYFSHVEGAVHRGLPSSRFEEFAVRISALAVPMNMHWLSVLAHIGTVVVRGLEPLRDAIASEGVPTGRLSSGMRSMMVLSDDPERLSYDWTMLGGGEPPP